MIFFHPCKNCIVKAACYKNCILYENFANKAAKTVMITSALMIITQIILIIVYLPVIPAVCLTVLSFLIPYMACLAIEDRPEFTKNIFLNIIISPWFLLIVIIAKATKSLVMRDYES